MRWYVTAVTMAFLGGLITGKSVLAQEQENWVSKPVVCGTIERITGIAKSKGLELIFGGNGFANTVNAETPANVYVFLGINPETKEWALTEVGPDGEGCILGYGNSFSIDAGTIQKLAGPSS